jgi:uncharacterized protein (TIGR03435 family)
MTSVSMDYFAYGLTFLLDRPVINRTGIQGVYDFTLAYTREPVEIMTIDHAEMPTAN